VPKLFRPFDPKVVEKEFLAIPINDRSKLISVMTAHEREEAGPIKIQTYGGGISCIRHISGRYQDRCLFAETADDLVILTVYKKETQEIPQHILERAQSRLKSI